MNLRRSCRNMNRCGYVCIFDDGHSGQEMYSFGGIDAVVSHIWVLYCGPVNFFVHTLFVIVSLKRGFVSSDSTHPQLRDTCEEMSNGRIIPNA
jgi:hypothetical protein